MSVDEKEPHRTTLFILYQSEKSLNSICQTAANKKRVSFKGSISSTSKLLEQNMFYQKTNGNKVYLIHENNLKHYISKKLSIKGLHTQCFRKCKWQPTLTIYHSSHLWVWSPCQAGARDRRSCSQWGQCNWPKYQWEIMGQTRKAGFNWGREGMKNIQLTWTMTVMFMTVYYT